MTPRERQAAIDNLNWSKKYASDELATAVKALWEELLELKRMLPPGDGK